MTPRYVQSIYQVDDIVECRRLAPAHVPPVTAVIGKHAFEVADIGNARSVEGGAGVGVSPGVTAIGGLEDAVVAGEIATPTVFVHTGDVDGSVARQVTGDLDVAGFGAGVNQMR